MLFHKSAFIFLPAYYVYSLKLSIDEGEEMGYSSGIAKQLESLTKITADPREESQKELQNMLENIF